ncbi:MAG: PAS domain-containing sensor histidine kinase [Acidobacteria bacterium]|nr:PAS domain-containing sensor histidine kinase [Acidobacteriota bacterium]
MSDTAGGTVELPYRQYFEAMPCYVTVQDRDFKVMTANTRFVKDFGNFTGRYCYQVYKQRPEKCEVCPVERTLRDGRSHRSEETIRCLDGREVSVIVYTEPILDADGEITAVMEMSTDITDIKHLQDQLHESQSKYRSLFEEVPCYISIQDEDLNIIDANRLHRKDFGTFLGCKCYEVYKHRTEECYPCSVRQTFADGQMRIKEGVVTSIKGEAINVLMHTAPIYDSSGKIKYVMEMSANISQVRQLQSQLASIGLLISSISHGIKGLLNSLNGGIYLVNKGLANDNRTRLQQGWEIVLRNVSRIRSMVLDILYYAKDREPDYMDITCVSMVDEVGELLREKAKELNVELVNKTDDRACTFEADSKAVLSMLVNLTENSLDACRLDSRKKEHRVAINATGDEDQVCFTIEDNGTGMDRETRENAFTLFFSSKGSEGTGLGLFIANKIVTAHGGKITLKSQRGVGTTFSVYLPRVRPENSTTETVETAGDTGDWSV